MLRSLVIPRVEYFWKTAIRKGKFLFMNGNHSETDRIQLSTLDMTDSWMEYSQSAIKLEKVPMSFKETLTC